MEPAGSVEYRVVATWEVNEDVLVVAAAAVEVDDAEADWDAGVVRGAVEVF